MPKCVCVGGRHNCDPNTLVGDKMEASLGYRERPCLNKSEGKTNKNARDSAGFMIWCWCHAKEPRNSPVEGVAEAVP